MINAHFEVQVLNGFGDGYQRVHLRALILKIHFRIRDDKLRREFVSIVLEMRIRIHLGVQL